MGKEVKFSRRTVLKSMGLGLLLPPVLPWISYSDKSADANRVYAHIWPFASQFPPDWDCTAILDSLFKDCSTAGVDGIEVMDAVLRNPGGVPELKRCVSEYGIPVIGSSYYADMWDKTQHSYILNDCKQVLTGLASLGGTRVGLTVGDARRKKTEEELDDQAGILKEIIRLCEEKGIQPNLHNHTFEMDYGQHDFLGTLRRIPGILLGPDINWLIRAGIDPVEFIAEHRERIVFMHLRDQNSQGQWSNPLGSGNTDFATLAKMLKTINYRGDVAIELAYEGNSPGNIREDLWGSRNYVREVFGW